MPLHAEAFAVFALRHALPPLTEADRAKLDGRRNSEIFPVLFGREMPREEWLVYEHEKEGLYRDLSRGRLTVVAGLPALLERLASARVAVAPATSAPEANVAHTLGEVGLTAAFPIVVRGDQVRRGKPAPDVFIEAGRQLGVSSDGCVVFEDAPMGIAAARAAGMRVVALTTSSVQRSSRRWTSLPILRAGISMRFWRSRPGDAAGQAHATLVPACPSRPASDGRRVLMMPLIAAIHAPPRSTWCSTSATKARPLTAS